MVEKKFHQEEEMVTQDQEREGGKVVHQVEEMVLQDQEMEEEMVEKEVPRWSIELLVLVQ